MAMKMERRYNNTRKEGMNKSMNKAESKGF
jgi:hypothetical protein